jgi:hypothetical protein
MTAPIGPMRYIDSPYKSESDYFWLCTAVNFLSVKIASSDVGFPIRVYSTIIVRDSIDVRFVYHFRRDSDNCQLINSEVQPTFSISFSSLCISALFFTRMEKREKD